MRVQVSGVSSASISWETFSNTTCNGTPSTINSNPSATGTVNADASNFTTAAGVESNQSIRLVAPTIAGKTFANWTRGSDVRTTSTICVVGSNGTLNWIATYTTPSDTTAPTTSATATKATSPASSYTFGDWSNKDVSVTLNATDTGGSNVKEIRYTTNGVDPTASSGTVYSGPFQISSEGTTTVKFRAIDNAGNLEAVQSQTVKIDKTAPTNIQWVGGIGNGDSFPFGSVPNAPTCTADGAVSGLASPCTVTGYSNAVGSHTLTATATDNATNSATQTRTYTVDKANQTITFGALADKTYGDAPFTLSANGGASGNPVTFALGTNSKGCSLSGTNNKTVTITGATGVGEKCIIVASQAGNTNYLDAASVTRDFTIAKAQAMLTLSGLTGLTYNGQPQGATVNNNPENLSGVNVTYNGNTQAPTNAGSYTVVASLDNPNYQATSVTDTLVIGKKSLTVTAGDKQSTYGDANLPANSVTYTNGFVNSEGPSVLGGTLSYNYYQNGNEVASPQNAGTYAIRPSGLTSGNYQISFVDGTLTINKATLDVNADNNSKTYGAANPTNLTWTYSGFVNGDTSPPAGLTGSADCSIAASAGPNAGTYTDAITCAPGSNLGSTNYNFQTGSKGTFTINKATPTITWSNPAAIDYGTALSSTQLNAQAKGVDDGNLDGNYNYTPNAGTVLQSGTKELKVEFTPTSQNYTTATKTVQIVVNPYPFNGFFQPIDNGGVYNKAKIGSTIPVKFSLGGDKGLNIFAAGYPQVSKPIACGSNPAVDAVEEYATATNSGLKYDSAANQYIYNWKTDSTIKAGECRQLIVKLADGSVAKTAQR